MKKLVQLTVGCLIGTTLIVGAAGVALAAPVTTATTAAPPSSSTPSTPGSTPSSTVPAKAAKPKVLTGGEIWRIVEPHHKIVCSAATKQIARIHRAQSAAATRLSHWQTRRTAAAARTSGTTASKRSARAAGAVRGFQKMEQDATALIKKIDAKCSVTSPTS
jgi:hypothetical protein